MQVFFDKTRDDFEIIKLFVEEKKYFSRNTTIIN